MIAANVFLRDLAVVLATAAVTTVVSQRLRLPVVVGYVVAGIIVGPHLTPQLITDTAAIQTFSELGVILLMFSIGLEFSLRRLGRLVPIVGPAAAVEVGLMFTLGYFAAKLLGWTPMEQLFTGAVLSISSTMIVGKAFEERRPPRRLEDLVLGVLVMEDLVAILLLVFLTAQATGAAGDSGVVGTVSRLLGFLALLLAGGMLVVPRAMRAVVALKRSETILVASVGLAFLFAELAALAGYSVALGAFLAGALVRESGTAHRVVDLLTPVRDMFAAIFFVAVGMQVDVVAAMGAWPAVVLLVAIVFVGKTFGVSLGGFLAGFGVRTSVQGGMTLAQIGEFSFVIAGLGVTTGAVSGPLYPVAVMVSVITVLLTPTMMRLADPISATFDRKLPKPVQTFVTLYDSWIELARKGTGRKPVWAAIRRPLRWMFLDAVVIAALIIGTTQLRPRLREQLASLGPGSWVDGALVAVSVGLALPFAIGLIASARKVAGLLAEAAMPRATRGVDQARSPRGVLAATIQIAIVLVLGLPLIAVTQPFLSAWPATIVVGSLLLLLAVGFWRSAADLQGHVRAGAELIVDVIARQGKDKDEHSLEMVQEMLPGLGTIVPFHVEPMSAGVGLSLGELNLRGLTGVTVVAVIRGNQRMVFPKADEVIQEGDVLALTGSHESIAAAHRLLMGVEHAVAGVVNG
ncbi:MAG TPA: cation:proton antiporter [Gemmatimonadales bacterium]